MAAQSVEILILDLDAPKAFAMLCDKKHGPEHCRDVIKRKNTGRCFWLSIRAPNTDDWLGAWYFKDIKALADMVLRTRQNTLRQDPDACIKELDNLTPDDKEQLSKALAASGVQS